MTNLIDKSIENLMNHDQLESKSKWWCIHFAQENLDLEVAKNLQVFFKRVTPNFVFGNKRVFLNVSQSKWKDSLSVFQSKLAKLAKKHHLKPDAWQWGFGDTIAESWVQARWRTLSPDLLPVEAISDYLNPYDLERKNPDEVRRIRLLRSLGVSSLQDLIDMQEDMLLAQGGIWIAEFTREHFSKPEEMRDTWLEKTTADSLLQSNRPFQLEDWIPEEYLEVG